MTNLPAQSIVAILQSLHNAYVLHIVYIIMYSIIYYNIYNTILCCSIIKCTISITTAFLKFGPSPFLGRMQTQDVKWDRNATENF